MTTCFSPVCCRSLALLAGCLLTALTGCHAIDLYTVSAGGPVSAELSPPRELSMVSHPTYRIAPPDILQIDALRLVPRPPYRLEAHDVLIIRAIRTIPDQPIAGYHVVEGEGTVNLGPAYGSVRVLGLTIDEATAVVTQHLRKVLQQPIVSIQMARSAGAQEVTGAYFVRPDGTVNLRKYGLVHVAGKTVTETSRALEEHLSVYFDSPQVGVDVLRYASQKYYVVVAGAERGEIIRQFPIYGNETVLDAVGQLGGLSQVSSKTMWLSRATPGDMGVAETLPVDWEGIARGGSTETNYQIFPGDRLYIADDNVVAATNYIGKRTTPIQRLLSISSLGASMTRNLQQLGREYNRFRRGVF